ncbi:DNA cytosine methyltransferase [[Leptolyngbya] sp. PCC 7376]|uniref:DNA cytosine methyltransferase n=1 Tax=[Leptolyngbya] sp. PCC 7376 TaxID=111781 RepID=UPI0005A2BA9B|nr:DNA cytosine methyltransferase [[Leptolyngbya] sp. PCC 7376]
MGQRPLVVDLFAGCGGMSLGLEAAGFDIAAAVEIDPVHALVHEFNFPYGKTFCRDVSTIHKNDIFEAIAAQGYPQKEIDVMVGGPPCQGFSMMGKRNLNDPRNRLIFEYVRLLDELQPKYFVFENVQGMASGKHRDFLQRLLSKLAAVGYQVLEPRVINSADYGAPQNRNRLILLGYRQNVKPLEYPEPTHGEFLTDLKNFVNVQQAIADLEDIPVFTEIDYGLPPTSNISPYSATLRDQFQLCHHRQSQTLQLWGHLGSNHREDIKQRFRDASAGQKEKISRLFKLEAQGLANTLRAGTPSDKGSFTAPRPIHYSQPRCISIREAARLHTFPDWFQLHRKVWHGFREIGNAVVPLLAKAIGDRLISALDIDSSILETKYLTPQNEAFLKLTVTQAADYWGLPPEAIAKRRRIKPKTLTPH